MKIVSVSKERINAIHGGMIFSFIPHSVVLNQIAPKEDTIIGYYINKEFEFQNVLAGDEYGKLILETYKSSQR